MNPESRWFLFGLLMATLMFVSMWMMAPRVTSYVVQKVETR